MKKKILNNITGLGYNNNLEFLKDLINKNEKCMGNHHIKNQINVLEGNFRLNVHGNNNSQIDLNLLRQRIIDKYY
jgi:hypothetical protein